MPDIHENEVLRDALSRLNEEVPPMPEQLHAAWMQKVEEDMTETRIEKTRTRRGVTRFLSVAAALVFVVGGTLLTRDGLDAALPRKSANQSDAGYSLMSTAVANDGLYDYVEDAEADFALGEDYKTAMYGADLGTGTAARSKMSAKDSSDTLDAAAEKKIIRTASMTITTQTFEDSLNALKASCEGKGGWIESLSENVNSYSGLRTAYLTLRIPQSLLDDYLAGTESLGRTTSRSESAQDVTASYQDTRTRLNTQLALMERLQALITESADLSDLLALENQIADTQYQIDTLQSSLNATDRKVDYSTVSITLKEEKTAPLTETTVSFGERVVSAIQVGWECLVNFLGDMAVFLVAALPFILIVVIVVIIIKLIKRRK
ncbi:MAG: DUF4349 domain-containing protein [Aristaeellaceae bacterium]